MSSFQEGTRERGYKEVDCGLVPLRNNFLLPTAKFDDQKFEFYFLMDGSGSMSGERWSLATRALLVCLLIVSFMQYLFVFPLLNHILHEIYNYVFSALSPIFTGRLLLQRNCIFVQL